MSKVHYFQRYSQKENVVTNNTLLLLSRLYSRSPLYLEAFLNDLAETGSVEIGVRFTQQDSRSGESVPDGMIVQPSLKIVVETKRGSDARLEQLEKHLEAFDGEDTQLLLLLTRTEPSFDLQRRLDAAVRDYNNDRNKAGVVHVCTTFERVIKSYESTLPAHDYEMRELLEDYRDFCFGEDLLTREEYWMRAVPCGKTYEDNLRFGVYYQPESRPYRAHRYVGVYKDKRVQGIGEIEDVVTVNLREDGLSMVGRDVSLTSKQQDRIEGAVRKAKERHGWNIATNHRFFLVEQFHETNFRKYSPGGMRGPQYFDLAEILDTEHLPSVEEVAKRLSEEAW